MTADRSEDFARAYAGWSDELDARNAGPLWWATGLPSRHPMTLSLPRRLAALLRGESDPAMARGLKSLLCAWLPLGPLAAAFRGAGRMAVSRLLSPLPTQPGPVDAIFSLAGPRSFASGAYRDQFFGQLAESLAGSGAQSLLWVFITDDYVCTLRRLPPGAVPIERTLTVSGLLRALGTALKVWAHGLPVDVPPFEGKDVRALVEEELSANFCEGRFLTDLLYGEALRGLLAATEVRTLYYPFENIARERSLLLALRSAAPRARAIGHQHSPLTTRQLNCRLGPRSARLIPTPDLIITSGPTPARRLAEWGWPQGRLRAGCSLRAEPPARATARPTGPARLLILLSQGPEEYRGLLRLVKEAFDGRADAPELVLRPHPVIALDPILAEVRTPSTRWRVEAPPLAEALRGCHAVLYASSAAAADAARAGVPAIWADWGDWLPADPLEGLPAGHSAVRDAAGLREAFTRSAALDDAARVHSAAAAGAFLDGLRAPVTPRALEAFRA